MGRSGVMPHWFPKVTLLRPVDRRSDQLTDTPSLNVLLHDQRGSDDAPSARRPTSRELPRPPRHIASPRAYTRSIQQFWAREGTPLGVPPTSSTCPAGQVTCHSADRDCAHCRRSGRHEHHLGEQPCAVTCARHLGGPMTFEKGQRVHIPGKGLPEWVTIFAVVEGGPSKTTLFVEPTPGVYVPVELDESEFSGVQTLDQDGNADSARVLAGMWSQWMAAAGANADTTVLASTPLRPYAHQTNAVYGAMLPQPSACGSCSPTSPAPARRSWRGCTCARCSDLGFVSRALIVCPGAPRHEVAGRLRAVLRRRTAPRSPTRRSASTASTLPTTCGSSSSSSLPVNPAVQDAIRPDRAGLGRRRVRRGAPAHSDRRRRSTRSGALLAKNTPRALLMTATPHRGTEWLFRAPAPPRRPRGVPGSR